MGSTILPVLGIALILGASATAAPAPATQTIATISRANVRAVVTAHKTTQGLAPRATVAVIGYRRIGSVWHRTGTSPLGAFFWKVVTHPHGLCKLRLQGRDLTISVLVTPSIGCDKTKMVRLES